LQDPKFKNEAGLGGAGLAEQLWETDPAAAKALAKRPEGSPTFPVKSTSGRTRF